MGRSKDDFGGILSESVGDDFSPEVELLLCLLRESLTAGNDPGSNGGRSVDWNELCSIARQHGVLALLYDPLTERSDLPEGVRDMVTKYARRIVQQSYRLLFLTKYLSGKMEKAGLPVVVLKGVGTASFYPVPELRKSGDVDLLLTDRSYLERACEILQECDCVRMKEQNALHHIAFCTKDGIEVEVHTLLAEPFDHDKINHYLENRLKDFGVDVKNADCMGVALPILNGGYHAYELLLHMLQHFLRRGFGLKFLCDWVVFWNQTWPSEEKEKYKTLVRESGLKSFSDIVTCTCVRYLGLLKEKVAWMNLPEENGIEADFLKEILVAEEFGKSESDRMVALRNVGPAEYIREFHHQMHLNFPRTGRCILLWPALWGITLVRFLRNNRKLRGVSTRSILKKAGQRGRLIAKMRLWK